MNSQTGYFVLAGIGAAAWLPQIAGWAAKVLAKPSVRVLPAPSVDIGFTNLGPIVNLPVAVLVKKKDALITDMRLSVTHENGESHSLRWVWIHEVMSYVRGLPANMNLAKQDRAIALIGSPDTVLNKTIGFQDYKFQELYRERVAALADSYRFLRDKENGREEFLNSRELALGLEWFAKAMFWAEGRYNLEIELFIEGLSPVRSTFSTALTKPEVELLKQNVGKMKDYVTAIVNADGKGQVAPEPTWNWITPTLLQ